ncbi:hypothetical protein EN742_34210, partial [Mesorhizobium sp. M4A.F.Ca.ET.020.02.1.1]|uniref:hypothetical protein n=1 Tax=Mesorhizobium sp. M4A.F.Ca.ET.020.02.1.1 TaxID=2496652 RepID=UPI000FD42EE2
MKAVPLLLAASVSLFGSLATQQCLAGEFSDHGGEVAATLPDDDDQGATAGDERDHDVAENDEGDHEGDGSTVASMTATRAGARVITKAAITRARAAATMMAETVAAGAAGG